MRIHYIYKTTNLINGKSYIGQRYCPKNKSCENDLYFGSGTHISNSIKKHGRENFNKEILAICYFQKDADLLEKIYMDLFDVLNNKDKWYNRAPAGQFNRSDNHSKFMSSIMKKFYSDPENIIKATAARFGMTVEEYKLHVSRKELIKKLKKIILVKKKEETLKCKKEKKKKKYEYINSDEYKENIFKKKKAIGYRQSNSEDFKRKVKDGMERALKLNPNLFKTPIPHDSKIQMSKSKLGDKACFMHHLFWDKNMSIQMAPKEYVYKIRSFLRGYSSYYGIDYRVYLIHESLKKMDMNCDIEKLIEYANNKVYGKKGERREKMNVVNYSQASKIAGVSRQRINGLKDEHFKGRKLHNYFVYDPKTSKPGINIDDKEWLRYVNDNNSQRVKQKKQLKTIERKPTVNENTDHVIGNDMKRLTNAMVESLLEIDNWTRSEMKEFLDRIEKKYSDPNWNMRKIKYEGE